ARVPGAVRDRGRALVRGPRRPDRRRGAPARRDALPARPPHPPAPRGALRGRRLAAAGPARTGVRVGAGPGRGRCGGWTRPGAVGELGVIDLERALVRSLEKLAYDRVQEELDRGEGHPMMLLLQEIGALRTELEAQRGGASLNVPEQEVVAENGQVRLQWRRPHPIEDANAQISLMTGMAAAALMLEHGAGILRTMPPAEQSAVDRFRRQSEALGAPWPTEQSYGAFLRSLDWRDPVHLALLNQATSLFRGASYAAFTSTDELPEQTQQAAIAAPYAHTTAPLRRLVDRFVLLVCHAHVRGAAPAPELLAALGQIPEAMRTTAARAGALERSALELVETMALEAWEGEVF